MLDNLREPLEAHQIHPLFQVSSISRLSWQKTNKFACSFFLENLWCFNLLSVLSDLYLNSFSRESGNHSCSRGSSRSHAMIVKLVIRTQFTTISFFCSLYRVLLNWTLKYCNGNLTTWSFLNLSRGKDNFWTPFWKSYTDKDQWHEVHSLQYIQFYSLNVMDSFNYWLRNPFAPE